MAQKIGRRNLLAQLGLGTALAALTSQGCNIIDLEERFGDKKAALLNDSAEYVEYDGEDEFPHPDSHYDVHGNAKVELAEPRAGDKYLDQQYLNPPATVQPPAKGREREETLAPPRRESGTSMPKDKYFKVTYNIESGGGNPTARNGNHTHVGMFQMGSQEHASQGLFKKDSKKQYWPGKGENTAQHWYGSWTAKAKQLFGLEGRTTSYDKPAYDALRFHPHARDVQKMIGYEDTRRRVNMLGKLFTENFKLKDGHTIHDVAGKIAADTKGRVVTTKGRLDMYGNVLSQAGHSVVIGEGTLLGLIHVGGQGALKDILRNASIDGDKVRLKGVRHSLGKDRPTISTTVRVKRMGGLDIPAIFRDPDMRNKSIYTMNIDELQHVADYMQADLRVMPGLVRNALQHSSHAQQQAYRHDHGRSLISREI